MKEKFFNKWCWEQWVFTHKNNKANPNLLHCAISSKEIKDIDVRPKTLKQQEFILYKQCQEMGIDKDFLEKILIAHGVALGIDKLGCIKLKSSAQQNKNIKETSYKMEKLHIYTIYMNIYTYIYISVYMYDIRQEKNEEPQN